MHTFELEVRDAAGFTFAFEYQARTKAEAIKKFKASCRKSGITKFKHIKIVNVIRHDD